MTDMLKLARALFNRIEWQNVPDEVHINDLIDEIAEAIRYLYVMTGRALLFSEEWFVRDEEGMISTFAQ